MEKTGMATDFTQDTVLHFLQISGGSVKNSDLLQHFRYFIRDHADRDRNRELFKKFINSVATVQQLDGVSYVVLKKKFRGHINGSGERGSSGPLRRPAGKNIELSPENAKQRAEEPRQKPQPREGTTPAPPAATAGKILPAAGIMLNNNNVETNFNLKHKHQEVIDTQGVSGRPPAAAQVVSQISEKTLLKTPSLSEHLARDQRSQVGQLRESLGPTPLITPVVTAVRHHGETSQQVPVAEPLTGRQVSLHPEGGLHQEPRLHPVSLHQEPPIHHISPHQERPLHHISLHQERPIHHINLHQERPLHHISLHQERPIHHVNLHQERPLHHISLHQERPIHHVNLHQERPLHHVSLHQERPLQNVGLHQEPPLQHVGLHQEPPLHHISHHQEPPIYDGSLHQVAPRRIRHRPSYKSAISCDEDSEDEEEDVPIRRGSAGGAWPGNAPLADMAKAISTSMPCIIDPPAPPSVVSSSEKKLPKIYIQNVTGETLPPVGPGWSLESRMGQRGQLAGPTPGSVPVGLTSSRCGLPSEAERYMLSPDQAMIAEQHNDVRTDHGYLQLAGVQLEPRQGQDRSQTVLRSSSHSSIFSPSSDAGFSSSDWPPSGSPRGSEWNSSCEEVQSRTAGKTGGGSKIQEVLQRAQRAEYESVAPHIPSKTLEPWHLSTGHLHDNQEPTADLSSFHHSTGHLHDDQEARARVLPWHLSTGDLYDYRDEAESSEGSTSTPPLRQHPTIGRRVSSQLRSRMCRSMGADLDQLLQEEARGGGGGSEAARLNRLHLISSSLSLRYNLSSSSLSSCSTPPRCHSFADLVEGVEGKGGRKSLPSTARHEGTNRQSLIPLDPKEHAWLVKGAAGVWPEIYSLFREDSSLLNRRDFISGFTVLHWIAKHGDHRVLNTLWYGVQKAGVTFDINARSTCRQTPLHIAAIHGHKNIIRLLVSKFNADVKLRDTAGKRAWQYLSCSMSSDMFQLLGAPPHATAKGGVGTVDTSCKPEQQQQRRRRRHHLSSASSGERPLTISGTARVKRSTSIAAFLKHKSLQKFHGHHSDSSV